MSGTAPMATAPTAALIRLAYAALREELAERDVDLSIAAHALSTAEESLLRWPRAEWPAPADRWERTVVALALAVRRLEGMGRPHAIAVRAVHQAAQEIAQETAQ